MIKRLFSFIARIFSGSKSQQGQNTDSGRNVDNACRDITPDPEIYPRLRNQLLSWIPEQFDLHNPSDRTVVFCVVMEWDLGIATATLYGMQTGDASLYLSTGGGVIGGVGHESVRDAAIKLVESGQAHLSKATRSDDMALPPNEGDLRLYFLTNKGRFIADDRIDNFESCRGPLGDLFSATNNLMTELRLVSPELE